MPLAVATSRDGPAVAAAAVAAVDCCGFGCVGLGQVTSAEFGWQNSRILSNKYHCLWMLRPGGGAAADRAAGGGTPCLWIKEKRCSSSDGCFFANTTPGSSDVNLAQNKHNGVDHIQKY